MRYNNHQLHNTILFFIHFILLHACVMKSNGLMRLHYINADINVHTF